MDILPIYSDSYRSNTYIVSSGSAALVIDPSESCDIIISTAAQMGLDIQGILLTHGHFDHVLSLDPLKNALKIKASIHEKDAVMLTDGKKNAFYTFFHRERTFGSADILLSDGDIIRLGDEEITVIHTPGHSEGSVCYHCGDFILTGDTLFSNTCGRYDLWGGDIKKLRDSLRHLRDYDKKTIIYAGHGDPALLGDALDTVAYYL